QNRGAADDSQRRSIETIPLLRLRTRQAVAGDGAAAGPRLDRAWQLDSAEIGVELRDYRSERADGLVIGALPRGQVMDMRAELEVVASLGPVQIRIPLVHAVIPELLASEAGVVIDGRVDQDRAQRGGRQRDVSGRSVCARNRELRR